MLSLRQGCACAVYKHRTILGVTGKLPTIGDGAFVAPSAAVIGDVTLGKGASVWYGTVLRGRLLACTWKDSQFCHTYIHCSTPALHFWTYDIRVAAIACRRGTIQTHRVPMSRLQVTREASE